MFFLVVLVSFCLTGNKQEGRGGKVRSPDWPEIWLISKIIHNCGRKILRIKFMFGFFFHLFKLKLVHVWAWIAWRPRIRPRNGRCCQDRWMDGWMILAIYLLYLLITGVQGAPNIKSEHDNTLEKEMKFKSLERCCSFRLSGKVIPDTNNSLWFQILFNWVGLWLLIASFKLQNWIFDPDSWLFNDYYYLFALFCLIGV